MIVMKYARRISLTREIFTFGSLLTGEGAPLLAREDRLGRRRYGGFIGLIGLIRLICLICLIFCVSQ